MFSSSVYYGPSHHRHFLIVVEPVSDHGVDVRYHHAVNTGDMDEVFVEFIRIQGKLDDDSFAISEAARRVRVGGMVWLRPDDHRWIVDGDALRAMSEELGSLRWLTGSAAVTPRFETQELLRAGGGAAQGRVIVAFDEAMWKREQKPWEKNWRISSESVRSGGQGTVRRAQSRASPEQFGALKVLHDQHQGNREFTMNINVMVTLSDEQEQSRQ